MNCGCGSMYTLTPGDRLYLSAMVKSLQQRVSALEGGGVGTDLGTFINAQIRAIIPTWALAPLPPIETDPTVPAWAKEATKPAYTVAEISGAASIAYVDAHANRTDNPHNVTAAQIGAAAIADLAPVAFSGDYNDLLNRPVIPAPVPQVNADWNATSGIAQVLNKPVLATVATSGDYNDLANKPAPGATQVNSDWNATSGVQEILNKPVLGSAASSSVSDFATAAQGAKADTALQAGDVAAMAYAADAPNDGNNYGRKNNAWNVISVPPPVTSLTILTADLNLYVLTTGNDSNNGLTNTAGGAFKTINGCINHIRKTYWLAGFTITINIGSGSFVESVDTTGIMSGKLKFLGVGTSTQWSAAGGTALVCRGYITIDTMQMGGGTTAACLSVVNGAQVTMMNLLFVAVTNAHVLCVRGGVLLIGGPYTIAGGGVTHIGIIDGGIGYVTGNFTITLSGTPAFTQFIEVRGSSIFSCGDFAGYNFSGSASAGTLKHKVYAGSAIYTNGKGVSFFPGGAAGTVATGSTFE